MAKNFKPLSEDDLRKMTRIRNGETKSGEIISCFSGQDFERYLSGTEARYVIVGIPEQAGGLANRETGGTEHLWSAFLEEFLNIQVNEFLDIGQITLGGYFDFSDELKLVTATAPDEEERVSALNSLVLRIDDQVEEIAKIISRHGKLPVIVGGGHNNAYGAIKGVAKGLHAIEETPLSQISAVSLSAHTGYRKREGRHADNAFRYADEDGYLKKYFAIGVRENEVPQYVVEDIAKNHFVKYATYEDIFLRNRYGFEEALTAAADYVGKDEYTGIELGLDAIGNIPDAGETTPGITFLEGRRYVHTLAELCRVAYFQICGTAGEPDDGVRDVLTGKLVSTLVSDFIKSHSKKLSTILQTSK